MPKGQGGGMAQGGGYSSAPGIGDMMGGGGGGGGGLFMSPEEERKAEVAALAELHKTGVLLQCVDGSNGTMSETPTRFYLQAYKNCGGLEGGKGIAKDELSNEGEGAAFASPVGPAWCYRSKGRNRIGDLEQHIEYVFGDGPDAYLLRFTSTNNAEVFEPSHAEVARSLRKGGAKKS